MTSKMTETNKSNNVIVVGAGLAGLALALGLEKVGYSVDILEQRTDFSNKGATFGLRPNGQKALVELCGDEGEGIVERLREIGIPIPTAGLMLPWYKVRDELLRVALEKRNIRIHLGCQPETVQELDSLVSAHYLAGDSTPQTLTGCLLIGCDGVNSFVRSKVLGLSRAHNSGVTTWRGNIVVPHDSCLVPLLDEGITPIFKNWGPTTFAAFNFHTKVPRMMAWSANTKDSVETNSAPWENFEQYIPDDDETKALVKEIFALSAPDDLGCTLDLRVIDPQTWSCHGRVTVIGDAAHAIRPASGLGGSLAFEDCAVLIREIVSIQDSVKDTASVQAMLERFIQARLPRVTKIWKDEWDRAESSYTGKSMPPPTKEWRDWIHEGV